MNQVLKLLRLSYELTIDDLSTKTGLSSSYISSLESGTRRISEDILTKYSKAFRIPKKTLRFFEETSSKKKLKTQELLLLLLANIYKGGKLNVNISFTDQE